MRSGKQAGSSLSSRSKVPSAHAVLLQPSYLAPHVSPFHTAQYVTVVFPSERDSQLSLSLLILKLLQLIAKSQLTSLSGVAQKNYFNILDKIVQKGKVISQHLLIDKSHSIQLGRLHNFVVFSAMYS